MNISEHCQKVCTYSSLAMCRVVDSSTNEFLRLLYEKCTFLTYNNRKKGFNSFSWILYPLIKFEISIELG